MSILMKLDRHAGLVNRMADTLEIDLAEAALRGEMAGQDFRSMVMSCVGCTHAGDCEHFLDEHRIDGAEEAPSYCRNHDLFDRLAHR